MTHMMKLADTAKPKQLAREATDYFCNCIVRENRDKAVDRFRTLGEEELDQIYDFRNDLTPRQLIQEANERLEAWERAQQWVREQDD